MLPDDCPICARLDQSYRDVAGSIQKLKQLVRTARATSDHSRLKTLGDTLALMEAEAAELIGAIERHRQHDHGAHA